MKTQFAPIAVVSAIALLIGFAMPPAQSVEVPAPVVTNAPPVAVVNTPVAERYLVLDTSRIHVGGPHRAGATLEAVINEHAAQGWRIRETIAPFIIFVQ